MSNLPVQTSKNSNPKSVRSATSSMDSKVKVGLSKLSTNQKAKMMNDYLGRKVILKVPQDILDSNPDKHFVYINMNKLEKTGYYHPEGYQLYKTEVDTENQSKEKFNQSSDGLVHRNEMVLAYLSKEEFEQREMEKELFRSNRDHTNVITEAEGLKGFSPFGKETVELM